MKIKYLLILLFCSFNTFAQTEIDEDFFTYKFFTLNQARLSIGVGGGFGVPISTNPSYQLTPYAHNDTARTNFVAKIPIEFYSPFSMSTIVIEPSFVMRETYMDTLSQPYFRQTGIEIPAYLKFKFGSPANNKYKLFLAVGGVYSYILQGTVQEFGTPEMPARKDANFFTQNNFYALGGLGYEINLVNQEGENPNANLELISKFAWRAAILISYQHSLNPYFNTTYETPIFTGEENTNLDFSFGMINLSLNAFFQL